jgi:hypothetical protein
MISRFFKKKPKASEAKKPAPERPERGETPQKLLTAEGWKRLMMKKTGKKKST